MDLGNAETTPLTLSTGDPPERDRLPFWREVIGQKVVHLEIEPRSDSPFEAQATLLAWPGLGAFWGTSTPAFWRRTSKMLVDGDDAFTLIICRKGSFALRRRANEISLVAGQAVGFLQSESTNLTASQTNWVALIVPRATLTPFVRDIDQKAMRLLPGDNEALRLLVKYTSNLHEEPNQMTPELRHLVVTHIHDLIAMALGLTPDGGEMANARGVRAARLEAIKADIFGNLGSPDLTVGEVARRQGVTPRYIHMLFESEGVTFSEFVCEARLKRAHSMLTNPRFCDRSIMTIAFAAGFGDLSYFNRCFRRRFEATPSSLRRDMSRIRKDKGQAECADL